MSDHPARLEAGEVRAELHRFITNLIEITLVKHGAHKRGDALVLPDAVVVDASLLAEALAEALTGAIAEMGMRAITAQAEADDELARRAQAPEDDFVDARTLMAVIDGADVTQHDPAEVHKAEAIVAEVDAEQPPLLRCTHNLSHWAFQYDGRPTTVVADHIGLHTYRQLEYTIGARCPHGGCPGTIGVLAAPPEGGP